MIVITGLRGTSEARFIIDELERLKAKEDPQERVRYERCKHNPSGHTTGLVPTTA